MSERLELDVDEAQAGDRLDRFLANAIADLSRSRLKALIDAGDVTDASGKPVNPKRKVQAGERFCVTLPEPEAATPQAENLPLEILFEDAHLIVLNKAAGMVVHPAPGTPSGTLVNALLHHCAGSLSGIGGVARPGIVHRLDKDTSGVMVAAKSATAHEGLSARFAAHDMERAYLAVTHGAPRPLVGRIEARIARHGTDRKKMAVVRESVRTASADWHDGGDDGYVEKGRHAVTNYKTLERFGLQDAHTGKAAAALVECRLETGRTHQIRVHMAHINTPVLGDQVYGRSHGLKLSGEGAAFDAAGEAVRAFRRQALHAAVLGFDHPVTGEALRFSASVPEDMDRMISFLRALGA